MILRRVMEHVRTQNWVAVGIDFFIVVVGVFMGLQLGNWNDERRDRDEEQEFLIALHREILAGRDVYEEKLAARTASHEAMQIAIDAIYSEGDGRELTDQECLAIAGTSILVLGESSLPSIDRLQANNRLSIISDDLLATRIATLQQSLVTADDRNFTRQSAVNLSSKYPEAITTTPYVEDAPAQVDGTELRLRFQCDVAAMQASPAFRNDLAWNIDLYDSFMRDVVQPYSRSIDGVHEALDAALGVEPGEHAGADG
ncbi:hypothetical protein HK107_09350 [Parvularcula sp. ZS-1/3]|uniref:Uncharacterized protein n=1 Tax=Parvularcula mediterranea TaxID=2732508 RepID=A0A7Y3W5E2_9PROT|nr:hypothetical protein [Parvularcula mediterranea]NNU16524.1 hypothetical protein [Parvularcula mediterranea]